MLTPSWDVERRTWFDNMEIVRPDENERRRSSSGTRTASAATSASRTTTTSGHAYVQDGVDRLRHDVRALPRPRGAHVEKYRERQPPTAIARSCVRHAWIRRRAAWSARSATRCATSSGPARAGQDYFDHFQPILEYGPRKESDPAYLADGRPRRFSNDALGLWQSECFLRGGATCTTCHQRSASARRRQEPAARLRQATRCASAVTNRSARRRPPTLGIVPAAAAAPASSATCRRRC